MYDKNTSAKKKNSKYTNACTETSNQGNSIEIFLMSNLKHCKVNVEIYFLSHSYQN